MGLDIVSNDYKKEFHIGYVGFHFLRSYFVLHYGIEAYRTYLHMKTDNEYNELLCKIGDLRILINHSDCEGELSSDECKLLLPCLVVEEDLVKSVVNEEVSDSRIKLMYGFIELIKYCADNDDVKLLFG